EVPHLICLQITKTKIFQSVTGVNTTALMWEKPEEYALYDKESQKQHEQDDPSFLQPQLSLSSSQEVSQTQQETNHDHMQSETSPVVEQV
ncbi:FCA-like protein, partial [Trifolium medium]|nr:FCA-like protein [Trifolium medium]